MFIHIYAVAVSLSSIFLVPQLGGGYKRWYTRTQWKNEGIVSVHVKVAKCPQLCLKSALLFQ